MIVSRPTKESTMPRFFRCFVLGLAAASLAATAGAQNLLTNGTFNVNISGWTQEVQGTGGAVFVPVDADGSPSSGSMEITNISSGAGLNILFTQCHSATAGTSYDYGGKVLAAPPPPAGKFYVLLNFYANSNCSGSGISAAGGSDRLDFTATGSWQGLTRTGLVAPAGTLSASITLGNFKTGAGGSTISDFDDIFLAVTGTQQETITIPVAASIHGANNTFFHSDVWVFNRSFTNQNTVTLTYHCFGGVGCGSPQQITLNPRESRLISDIVGTLFNAPETGGAIDLSWNSVSGSILARSRLYTPASPPTFGFGVPAFAASDSSSRSVFVGIAGSGADLTQGFRSNAGAYNPNSTPVTVTFTLFDGSTGAQIGAPFVRVWAPFEAAQVSNVIPSLGGSVVTTNAVLVASASGGSMFFYASTVDNLSGDAFFVLPGPDEAAP
jgi:hypothetical protein